MARAWGTEAMHIGYWWESQMVGDHHEVQDIGRLLKTQQ
jgi:hypothetical protein